jgi:hypothetical protein
MSRVGAEFIFYCFSDEVSVLFSLTLNNLITVLFMSRVIVVQENRHLEIAG